MQVGKVTLTKMMLELPAVAKQRSVMSVAVQTGAPKCNFF